MKNNFLANIVAALLVVSVLFFVDYLLVSVVGLIAGAMGATSFFFENIYPYIIAIVVAASVAYPLTAMLMKRNRQNDSKVLPFIGSKHAEQYKQSA